MALIAVCLSVAFVICGRANEGSGGKCVRVGGRWKKEEQGVYVCVCVREQLLCVSCRSAGVEADLFPQ